MTTAKPYNAGQYPPTKYQRHLELLHEAGFITIKDNDKSYFVGLGSHGGSGNTPQKAVKACLWCCNIGDYWRLSICNCLWANIELQTSLPMARDVANAIFLEVLSKEL